MFKVIHKFKAVLLTFLLVLILSVITAAASLIYPWLKDILVASPRTPWGIVTSLFTHPEVQNLIVNMLALSVFLVFFVTSNIFLSDKERKRRVRFLILTILMMAIISNLFWIIVRPDVSVTGSSGLVFAAEGVVMGFAFLNSLRLRDIRKWDSKTKKSLLAIYLYNLTIFMVLFLQIILDPRSFLNVAPGVNVFVHGIAFYISFLAAILFPPISQLIRERARIRRQVKEYLFKIHFLPLTAGKCVLLIGIMLSTLSLLSLFFPQIYQVKPEEATSILALYSQLLTTIFAITISVTLLGIQYLAQVYTPRSIKNYFKDWFFAGFLGTYVVSITLNLIAFTFPQILSPEIFLFPSLILLLFCLVYLIAYPFNVIRKLQPIETLKSIHASFPRDLFHIVVETPFWSGELRQAAKEPVIVLEQMIIQSIRNNDFDSYRQSLRYLTRTSIMLIEEARKEYTSKKDLDLLAARTDSIVAFLYLLQKSFVEVSTEWSK